MGRGTVLKGQASLEYLMVISIALLLFVFSILSLAKGMSFVGPLVSDAEFIRFQGEVFRNADSVTPGSQRVVQLRIPAGISEFSLVNHSNGWSTYRLCAGAVNITKSVAYNLTLVPANLTDYAGMQTLRIHSEREGEVIVERVQ